MEALLIIYANVIYFCGTRGNHLYICEVMPRTYIYINLLHRSTLYKLANCTNFIYAWIESTTLPVCSCKVPDSWGAEGVGQHYCLAGQWHGAADSALKCGAHLDHYSIANLNHL